MNDLGRKEGKDLPLQFPRTKKDREMIDDMAHQFRDQSADLSKAHVLEETAFPHPRFHEVGSFFHDVRVASSAGHIDHHPVIDRMVGKEVVGIGQNGVALRKRCQDVGIELQALEPDDKKPRHGENHQGRQGSSQEIFAFIEQYFHAFSITRISSLGQWLFRKR